MTTSCFGAVGASANRRREGLQGFRAELEVVAIRGSRRYGLVSWLALPLDPDDAETTPMMTVHGGGDGLRWHQCCYPITRARRAGRAKRSAFRVN